MLGRRLSAEELSSEPPVYAPEVSHRASILRVQINKIGLTEFWLFAKVDTHLQRSRQPPAYTRRGVLTAIQLMTLRQSREGSLSTASNTKMPSTFPTSSGVGEPA